MQLDYTVPTDLCVIMGKYGSDKGSIDIKKSWHNYTVVYNHLFKNRRYDNIRLFELGIGTNNTGIPCNMGIHGRPGASLYGWKEYFSNSHIFAGDIDSNILFETDRIKTYFCDQTNPQIIANMWNQKDMELPFDIIIDDGLHVFNANVCLFENSVHKLAKGGIYVIEDILNQNLDKFKAKINEWSGKYSDLKFELLQVPSIVNKVDNNLLIIQRLYAEQCG